MKVVVVFSVGYAFVEGTGKLDGGMTDRKSR